MAKKKARPTPRRSAPPTVAGTGQPPPPLSRSNLSIGGGAQNPRAVGMTLWEFQQQRHKANPERFPPPGPPVVHEVVTLAQRRSGHPSSMVQRACALEFEQRIPMLCRIADAEEVRLYEVLSVQGDVVPMMVQPTIIERLKAMEMLARVGRLYDVLPPTPPDEPADGAPDLSQLSTTELELLQRLLKLAHANPVPHTST